MTPQKMIELCDTIIIETENDVQEADGQVCNGKTVAVYFGKQAASIVALATMLKELINIK